MGYIKLKNRITGTDMWVDESRKAEYAALGHHTVPVETKQEIKKETKRTTKKKV